jgi:uncharacterized iron-regulated protein
LRDAALAGAAALILAGPALSAEITPAGLARLPSADVVVLGEVHDNPAHHANQASAVAAIRPAALVFEMLTPAHAARTPAARDDAAAMDAAYGWTASGWPDFAMYHPIFTAAPDAAIYGGDLPPGEVRRAVSVGAPEVFGPDAGRFGLLAPLAPGLQAALEAELDRAHCGALSPDLLPGMAEAQRLRDAALARATLRAFEETGGPVAVITGNGHARRDRGLPAVLALAAPDLSVLSIGQIEGPAGPDQPHDLWLVTGTIDRGDPCAAFGTETRLRAPDAAMPG